MIDCPKCKFIMFEYLTEKGALLDTCHKCSGLWFDNGELLHFVKNPKEIIKALEMPLINSKLSEIKCPRCNVDMEKGGFLSARLEVERCPACNGMWFDKGEVQTLQSIVSGTQQVTTGQEFTTSKIVEQAEKPKPPLVRPPLMKLPGLAFRSTIILLLLYGFVFLMSILIVEIGELPAVYGLYITCGFAILQFIISPFIMDLMLQWLYNMHWIHPDYLSDHLKNFIATVCRNHKMPFPKIGMIDDGTPNAFTYGHIPSNARIVFTAGLVEKLEPDELEAVIGHEIGHARHWDMLIMTIAALVPVVLYWIYRIAAEASRRGRRDKGNAPAAAISIAAFILYIISQYLILYLSRTREYWADRFAGEATGDPNRLSRALVKIAYGMASEGKTKEAYAKEERSPSKLAGVNSIGIFDPAQARALVTSSLASTHSVQVAQLDVENVKAAMQWDLWNPWALYYELHSTHPLPAKRINALSNQSLHMGIEPFVNFDLKRPESYWDEFFVDCFNNFLPTFVIIIGIIAVAVVATGAPEHIWNAIGLSTILLGFVSLIKLGFKYRGDEFPMYSILALLKKVKVSAVRPIPCQVKGTIIGRGIPGYVFSEDIVLQDKTGYIFLDYRQPLKIFEFFFGLFRTPGIIGREVIATGWYRRAPVPFIELKSMMYTEHGHKQTHTCYVYHMKKIFSYCLIALGIILAIAL